MNKRTLFILCNIAIVGDSLLALYYLQAGDYVDAWGTAGILLWWLFARTLWLKPDTKS